MKSTPSFLVFNEEIPEPKSMEPFPETKDQILGTLEALLPQFTIPFPNIHEATTVWLLPWVALKQETTWLYFNHEDYVRSL